MTVDSVTAWLLAAETPSIRCFTLTRLMGLGADDPRVVEARRAVQGTGAVPEIFSRQTERGDWANEHSYYTPKYTSTHWSLLLLDELGADGADPHMRRGADFMLNASLPWEKNQPLPHRLELECLYGNILRYTARCGMHDDPRAVRIIEYLARCGLEGRWTCPINYGAPCAWGAARALWGLAGIPEAERSPLVNDLIASGRKLLLEDYALAEAGYPVGEGKVHPLWFTLNFPLFYQTDILFVLRVLGELGALDHPNARPALGWLRDRQKPDGRFQGKSPFRQRTYSIMGKGEETDRWVTLHALAVLKHAPEAN